MDLCQMELLETKLLGHLTVYLQYVFKNHIVDIYVKKTKIWH